MMPARPAAPAILAVVALLSSVLLPACVPPPRPVPAHPDVTHYVDPRSWLCLPGRQDACASDLTATELHPDGSRTVERRPAAADPKVDCFYVYPTVDLDLIPRNHDDFTDLEPMTDAVVAQAARFRETCAIYAPLYRQVTIGAYLHPDSLDARLAFAFSDVEAAFQQFLADRDRGRPLVLIGHSQGAEMVVRLLRKFFDSDPVMRARLLLALPIGGDVETAPGKSAGGTLANIPLCTKTDETACVVAYRSYEAGAPMASGRQAGPHHVPGNVAACVNPAGFSDGEGNAKRVLSRAYFPVTKRTRHWVHADDVETPFVELGDFYAAQCVEGSDGYRYLAISLVGAGGDQRSSPVDFRAAPLRKYLGLHVLDLQLAQGDLVDLVARRAAALR